jgi:UDP-N-acetylmuramyl pentapeptide synthase
MKAAARSSGTLERQAEQAMVAALARQLGVSHSAAQRAMNQINALSDRNGVDPASPAFAAIAHELGVTPARLAAALDAAKQAAGRSVGGN